MSALRILCVVALVLAAACAKQPPPAVKIGEALGTAPGRLASPPTFVRVKEREEHELLARKIKRTNLPETTLLEAIWSALPFYVTVEGDNRVDLARAVSVRADAALAVGDYLRYLSQLTDYHFELLPETRVVRVSSRRAKTWNLAPLASAGGTEISLGGTGGTGGTGGGADGGGQAERDGRAGGTGAAISKSITKDDPWRLIVAEANCIMETPACGAAANDAGGGASARAADGSWVSSNRLNGVLRASGPPQKIAQLDRWLGPLQKSAARFVRLEVAVFEVLLDTGRGQSVDFRVLNEGIDRTLRLDGIENRDNRRARYSAGIVGNALENAGSLVLGATARIGDVVLDFVFRFLETEGQVALLNRANLIIPNGETATMRSVESFYYVDDQELIPGDVNNPDRISTSLARESVGLEIAITPQFLDERRLLVSIVPALSALQRFDNIESAGVVISEAPRTTLTTLSARGVTENGRPIALGGISTEGMQTRATGVGAGGVPDGGLLDSGSHVHQRRQLIVLVIPHEVEV